MPRPARTRRAVDEPAPVDPSAVERAYRLERARRRARLEHQRERRRAAVRFFVTLAVLLLLSVLLTLTVWRQVQRLFGL